MSYLKCAWTGLIAALFSLALEANMARADVVSPPPDGVCPPGSKSGGASHGLDPASCVLLKCSDDSKCAAGEVCREQQLCATGNLAAESCSSTKACSGAWPCTPLKVCISKELAEKQDAAGCSCGLAPESGGLHAALVLGLGCAALLSMRRSRPRPEALRRP